MTHTKDEALKLMIDALKASKHGDLDHTWADEVIVAGEQALAAPTVPVQSLECAHCHVTIDTLNDKAMYLIDENQRLRAELKFNTPPAAQPAPVQWQPVETAPKDVSVLLYGAKRLEVCVGMHHSRDGWVTDTTSEWASMYPPTHWMPLPAAPEKGQP
jgi:hypothetical protein